MDYTICLSSFYAFLQLTLISHAKAEPIANGQPAKQEDYPYVVSLRFLYTKQAFCTGSIISSRHVITAAHCFCKNSNDTKESCYEVNIDLENVIVVAGTDSLSETGEIYRIKETHNYIDWEKAELEYSHDIIVLTIKEKITFTRQVQRISLPIETPPVGKKATMVGYGINEESKCLPKLQFVNAEILSDENCKEISINYDFEPPYELCVYAGPRSGACKGDSGGPLVYRDDKHPNGVLVGVMLWGDNKSRFGKITTLGNVYKYMNFISYVFENRNKCIVTYKAS